MLSIQNRIGIGVRQAARLNLEPETIIQKNRVIADGGTIINLAYMNLAIKTYKSLGIYGNARLLTDANFAVKKDGSGAVSKLYDISGNNNDAVQLTGASQPMWSSVNGKGIITYSGNKKLTISSMSSVSEFTLDCNIKLDISQKTTCYFTRYQSLHGWVGGISDGTFNVVKFYLGGSTLYSAGPLDLNLHSVVNTYKNGVASIYLDGNINSTVNQAITFAVAPDTYIGSLDNNSQFFTGQINSSKLFDIALTSTQITTLKNLSI